MICEACGESNRPGTEFCAFCGSYLAWDPSAAATTTTSERTVRDQPPAVASSAPAPTTPIPATAVPVAPPPAAPVLPPPTVAQPQPSPVTAPEPAETSCPACGRTNPPSRRFCAHCGHRLLADAAATRAPIAASGARRSSWWSRWFDNRDRAARREYRRSLPALYRWRRVLIVLGLVGGLVAGLAVAGRNPVGFVIDRYHDVRGTLAPVAVIGTAIEPPEASVPDAKPAALTDGTLAAWSMRWAPTAEASPCGTPGTGVIVLTIEPTRVRALNIRAGLPADDDRRTLQALPQALGVSFDGGTCQEVTLEDKPDEQEPMIDSMGPVSTIRIGVVRAKPQREDGEPVLSFTEIGVRARPA